MEASRVEPAVLERIGATLDDVLDDVLTEPLPKNIKDLLGDEPPILCMLLDALTNPAQYRINEVDGEVFIFPSETRTPLPDDRP